MQTPVTKTQWILPKHVAVLFLTTASLLFSFSSFFCFSLFSSSSLSGASFWRKQSENFAWLSRTLQKCQKTSWSASLLLLNQQPFSLIRKLFFVIRKYEYVIRKNIHRIHDLWLISSFLRNNKTSVTSIHWSAPLTGIDTCSCNVSNDISALTQETHLYQIYKIISLKLLPLYTQQTINRD